MRGKHRRASLCCTKFDITVMACKVRAVDYQNQGQALPTSINRTVNRVICPTLPTVFHIDGKYSENGGERGKWWENGGHGGMGCC